MITQILTETHLLGLAIGLCTFLIIGLFHPVVIKFHYRFGTGCWWWFLILGIICIALSLWTDSLFWGAIAGVTGFSSFWTIKEIFDQEKRVERGWFPANPRRRRRDKITARDTRSTDN